jgi:DUF883 C-terminal glycine zipper region
MTTDTTTQLREELEQARSEFRRTADELRRTLEIGQLGLDSEVRQNPLKSVAIAGALGFLLGRASRPAAVLIAMVTGAAVGYSIAARGRATNAHGAPAQNDGTQG